MSSTSRGRSFSQLGTGAAGQLAVGLGSLLALLSPIWLPLAAAGALLMVLGVVVSAPEARESGPYLEQWWTAMGLASLACLTGFGLELVLPVIGGVLLSAGGAAGLLVVALATPPRRSQLSE